MPDSVRPIARLVIDAFDADSALRVPLVAELRARRTEWSKIELTDAHLAAMTDDVELLERTGGAPAPAPRLGLMSGLPVQGWSLLEIAAGAGSARVVEALLARTEIARELGDAGRYAAERDHALIVERLAEAGADLPGILFHALESGSQVTSLAIASKVRFTDDALEHVNIHGVLSPATPPAVLDRLLAAGLLLDCTAPAFEDEPLAQRIGEHHDVAWAAQLLERGYRFDTQRTYEMLAKVPEDARDAMVPLLDLALGHAMDLEAAIVRVPSDEDEPPATLFDAALEQFPIAVAQRLFDAGARPTGRPIRTSWPDGKEKLAWLATVSTTAAAAATPALSRALGPTPHTLKKLVLDREESPDLASQRDLAGIEVCKKLVELQLEGAALVELDALAKVPSLRVLDVMHNQIEDLAPLAGLTRLTSLDVANNQVRDVRPLASLARLKQLYLADNPVQEIAALRGLNELAYLSLRSTEVQDLSPIAELPKLETLVVAGCTRLSAHSQKILAALRARGVEVHADEPAAERAKPKKPAKKAAKKSR